MIERLVENFNEKVDAVFCGYSQFYDNGEKKFFSFEECEICGEQIIESILKRGVFTAVWNKMFRKESLRRKDGSIIFYKEGICVGEDFLWLVEVLQNCNFVRCIENPLYNRRMRNDSASGGYRLPHR